MARRHGLFDRLTYNTLSGMRRRCYDRHHLTFPDYGARGITVYFEWLGEGGYEAFVRDVGKRPGRDYQLDRIDSTLGYAPGNVRWVPRAQNLATAVSQAQDAVTAVGPDGQERTLSLGRWAELLDLKYRSLSRRLQRARTPAARAAVFRRKNGERHEQHPRFGW